MTKTNPLKADRLGPFATVRMDGKVYKVLRPTSLGWELETGGARPEKKFLFHRQLEQGEDDGTIVVTRSRSEHPSLQSLPLKSRRDIFIKNWWMSRIVIALGNRTLESMGDVALGKFIADNLPDIRRDLEAWGRDAGYDHAAAAAKPSRKATVGSEITTIEPVLTPRSLRRLLPTFVEKNKHPLSMRKRTERCRGGGRRVDDRVLKIVQEEVARYAGEANPTIEGLRLLVKARITQRNKGLPPELKLLAPSWGTLNRVKDEMPEGQKIGGRKGARAVNVALGPFGEGPTYYRLGERVEIDCWNIPLFILLEKAGVAGEIPKDVADELVEKAHRIHVAAVVEKATGYITGMRFGLSESAELTTAALKMSLIDKTRYSNWAGCEQSWNLYTGIEECTTDAGPGFIGDRFVSAVIPATSSHVYAASGLPHLRGLVESIYSTLHKGFISKFVARAFENVTAKGDYEPDKRANLTLEEFLRLMTRYVVDVYHNMPRNGGLRQSPHREFEAFAHAMEPKEPPTPDEIRVWFGFEAERKLGPAGVRFMHIHYDSDWLVKYRNSAGLEDVMIRVDEADLGAISVLLDGDWITIPARDYEFRGVSLDDWTDLLADLRKRFGVQSEVDFERYVAPALLEIERTNRVAEAMKLDRVFWSAERFEAFEDSNQINFVDRTKPDPDQPAPSFGDRTIGHRFGRASTSPTPASSDTADTSVPATAMASIAEPSQPARTRRLQYRED